MLENRCVGIREVAEALNISYGSTQYIVVHMRCHIPTWLWLNFWLNTKQKSLLSHRICQIWLPVTFSCFQNSNIRSGYAPWVDWVHKNEFTEGTKSHRPRPIRSVWKIGLNVGMLLLTQKEPILKAIIKICIKIHKNVVFFNQSGSHLIRCYIKYCMNFSP